jgi:hypothetical protein
MLGSSYDKEERSRWSIHRVVNAASVVVLLPFDPYGCARQLDTVLDDSLPAGAPYTPRTSEQ